MMKPREVNIQLVFWQLFVFFLFFFTLTNYLILFKFISTKNIAFVIISYYFYNIKDNLRNINYKQTFLITENRRWQTSLKVFHQLSPANPKPRS